MLGEHSALYSRGAKAEFEVKIGKGFFRYLSTEGCARLGIYGDKT